MQGGTLESTFRSRMAAYALESLFINCRLSAGRGTKFAGGRKSHCPFRRKVILDTDIGDDIDDAYALALVLTSPEVKLLGVTTAWGDTGLRAQLVEGILCETGQQDIPVIRRSFNESR